MPMSWDCLDCLTLTRGITPPHAHVMGLRFDGYLTLFDGYLAPMSSYRPMLCQGGLRWYIWGDGVMG